MSLAARMVLILFAVWPAVAAAQAETPGYYVSDMMEVGSVLELDPDGTYRWQFDYGSLSLSSRGRWTRRDAATILLDSEGGRVAPSVELARTSRDDREGVAVALEPDSLMAARILEIEAEYADGTVDRMAMERIRRRLPSSEARRLVAIRLGSELYDFASARFAVAAGGDNVLSFRIAWNDLNRVDFRSLPARIVGDRLLFEWRGTTLSHRRAELTDTISEVSVDREASVAEGPESELPFPLGPVPASALAGDEPVVGRLAFAPGEPLAATRAGSTLPFSDYDGSGHAEGVAELRLRLGDFDRDLGRVAALSWYVTSEGGAQRIRSLGFSHQDRLLELGEALGRARSLADGLARSGFVPGAAATQWADFRLIDPYRYDERVSGWDEAATLLGDADAAVTGMELFSLRKGDWYVLARLINVVRNGERLDNARPGREWSLDVELIEAEAEAIDDTAAEEE